MRESMSGSAAISRVLIPLPTRTASARDANSSGRWRRMVTPFIDVTSGVGEAMCASQPLALMRLRIAAATNESSSLKPSNVRTAICMNPPQVRPPQG
jgi:hypothetical protein